MAVSDRDKAMAGLLRQSLANDGGLPGDCMHADTLAAYLERSLDPAETSRCDVHLSRCSRCRQQMAMMGRSDAPLRRPEISRGWLWDWRFLATAATALLILTVWVTRRPSTPPGVSGAANQPLVAMSKPEEAIRPQPTLAAPSLTQPSRPAVTTAPVQEPDRISSSLQTSAPEIPKALKKEERPVNGRDFPDQLKLEPAARSNEAPAAPQSTTAEEPSIAPASLPSVSSATAAPASPSLRANRAPNATDALNARAKDSAVADALKTRLAQSPARADSYGQFGAPNQAALARQTDQRSVATIIATPDPKVLWRIAAAGFVERSEDAGATWRGQLPEANAHLTAGAAPATKVCWLVGEDGVILVTKDANHWKKIPPPIPANFVSVMAKNASSATVTAADGQKFSTTDTGKKWVPAP